MENRKSLIHCIGDSHVLSLMGQFKAFSGYHIAGEKDYIFLNTNEVVLDNGAISPIFEPLQIHWLGPRIAYNLFKRKPLIDKLIEMYWKEGDYLLFCIGELDCRYFIYEQSKKQNRTIKDVAVECVGRYFSFIYDNYVKYNLIGYWSVPNTAWGTPTGEEHRVTSREFNCELERLYLIHQIPYISFLEELQSQKIKYHDGTHLEPQLTFLYMKEKLKKMNLKGLEYIND